MFRLELHWKSLRANLSSTCILRSSNLDSALVWSCNDGLVGHLGIEAGEVLSIARTRIYQLHERGVIFLGVFGFAWLDGFVHQLGSMGLRSCKGTSVG